MVREVAALAIVEIKPPDSKAWPTNSGQVYVSSGTMLLLSKIRFEDVALPPMVTKLTLMVTFAALVFVMVNLSMMVLQLTAVYCVVWLLSACLAGISTFTVTVMLHLRCCCLL